jgi:exopolysaccharide production protein ExoZ
MRTIVSVQALRAIAALAVTLCHFDQIDRRTSGLRDPYPLQQLSSGVDLFFVISGFVMVVSSENLFATQGGAITFLVRRLARIVPPYWLMTAIAIPGLTLPNDLWSLMASYLFIPYQMPNGIFAPIRGRLDA